MPDATIISEKPMNIYQLRDEFEKIKKRDKELNIRVARTEEYINQVGSISNAKKLEEALVKLDIPRLKEQHIHKIIDILPTTVKDLKVVLQGYTVTVSNDNLKKIADTINECLDKK